MNTDTRKDRIQFLHYKALYTFVINDYYRYIFIVVEYFSRIQLLNLNGKLS